MNGGESLSQVKAERKLIDGEQVVTGYSTGWLIIRSWKNAGRAGVQERGGGNLRSTEARAVPFIISYSDDNSVAGRDELSTDAELVVDEITTFFLYIFCFFRPVLFIRLKYKKKKN